MSDQTYDLPRFERALAAADAAAKAAASPEEAAKHVQAAQYLAREMRQILARERPATENTVTIADVRKQFPMYPDISDGELVRGVHKKFYSDMPYQDFLRRIDFTPKIDPTKEMSSGDRALAGVGQGIHSAARGIGQLAGVVSQENVDQAKKLDAPLLQTPEGMLGSLAGNVAVLAPTALIPGANTYTGAATIGALSGFAQPVATGESRVLNTGVGAGAGVGGQAVGNIIGRAIRPISSRLAPEQERLAQQAMREGIPLTAGQRTGSRPLQVTDAVMENLPLTSGPQLARREAQQRTFTAAALRRAGIQSDEATADVLTSQQQSLGSALKRIAEGHSLDFYRPNSQGVPLINALDDILKEAERRGTTASEPVRDVVMNIVNEVNKGAMSGPTYQAWRQALRPLTQGGGADAHAFGQIRRALDSAFNEQIGATGGAQAWKEANRQYANLKTIMQAAGGPGAPAAAGQISPAQLATALRSSFGKEGVSTGRGDLNDLSRIGQLFVKEHVPNSGTAQRQFVQNALTGQLAGAVPGAGIGYATGGPEGAGAGAALGAALMLGGPKAAQVLLNSKPGQAYLTRGAVPLTEAQRRSLAAALRTSAIGATAVNE